MKMTIRLARETPTILTMACQLRPWKIPPGGVAVETRAGGTTAALSAAIK